MTRRYSYATPQTKHRIEHCAGGVRQRSIFHNGNRIGRCVTATQEASAISFVLHRAYEITLDHNDVNAPDGLVLA